ncbi:hypothetical protein N9F34_04650 [Alphaproteobacteria bacterium]|nr:hypothetical protein [Alphaproteobacteria bacterium]
MDNRSHHHLVGAKHTHPRHELVGNEDYGIDPNPFQMRTLWMQLITMSTRALAPDVDDPPVIGRDIAAAMCRRNLQGRMPFSHSGAAQKGAVCGLVTSPPMMLVGICTQWKATSVITVFKFIGGGFAVLNGDGAERGETIGPLGDDLGGLDTNHEVDCELTLVGAGMTSCMTTPIASISWRRRSIPQGPIRGAVGTLFLL